MKRLLLIGLTTLLPAGAVFAADLPVKAPPRVAAPVYGWTGFYAGLNAGGTWSSDNSMDTVSTPVAGFIDGIGPGTFAARSAAGATGAVPLGHSAGFIGGGQIGYNMQFAPTWVAGLEADIQGVTNNKHGGTLNTVIPPMGGCLVVPIQ